LSSGNGWHRPRFANVNLKQYYTMAGLSLLSADF
jgi:hypothetical protein